MGVNPGGPPLPLVSILWNYGGQTTSRITVTGRAVIPGTAFAGFRAVWRQGDGSFAELPALSITDEGTDGAGNRQFAILWDGPVPGQGATLLWPWGASAIQGAGGGGLGTLLWDGVITEVLTYPGEAVPEPYITGVAVGGVLNTLVCTLSEDCIVPQAGLQLGWTLGGSDGGLVFSQSAVGVSLTSPTELVLEFVPSLEYLTPQTLRLDAFDGGPISAVSGRYLQRLPGGAVWGA